MTLSSLFPQEVLYIGIAKENRHHDFRLSVNNFFGMGNSDSKPVKANSAANSTISIAQSVRIRVHSALEAEFEKRVNQATGGLSRDNFHACLRVIQGDFDLYCLSGSPLGIGLFEVFSNGQAFLSKEGYASAMGVVFDSNQTSASLLSITTQSILKWYEISRPSMAVPTQLTNEILLAFFEASWKFAWTEVFRTLSSNMYLNGREETRALERFADSNKDFFTASNIPNLSLGNNTDRTISISVGDTVVSVPTSFSYMSSHHGAGGLIQPAAARPVYAAPSRVSALSAPVRGTVAYPEL
jgi:hypothetical protein